MILHEVYGKSVMFRGNRKVIPNCMISIMTVRRLIKKGCSVYLTQVRELEKSGEVDKIPVAREFPDVFLE